jgi:parallel beta-helix repeat protein
VVKLNKAILASFTVLSLVLISSLMGCELSVKASPSMWTVDDDRVEYSGADFTTIQEAVNNATDGDTIFVYKGVYYENVIVSKSVSLVGEDKDSTIVDGNETGSVISITANNVSIEGFTLMKSGTLPNDSGIFLDHSNDNDISHNIIADNNYGIGLYYSINNLISDNTITDNNDGISLYYSINNLISDNTITDNNDGISLYYSSNNVVSHNTIADNTYGILLLDSKNNVVFQNNFVQNGQQAYIYNSVNIWDDGNEGNYWSNYVGVDLYKGPFQNKTGSDGIGDSPHIITPPSTPPIRTQVDSYPLMGMFYKLTAALEGEKYCVTTISNSTISEFRFEIGVETGNRMIRFKAGDKDSAVVFCRIAIPTGLMAYPYMILADVTEIEPTPLEHLSNETYTYLYFTYIHNNHTITIISSRTRKLETDLHNLNATYSDLLNSYSVLSGNYSQLQESYLELNARALQNVHNIQNLVYFFAATTAVFIIVTIYLSKHAHAGKTKVFGDTPKERVL